MKNKKTSIRNRVTLYYSFALIVISGILITVLLLIMMYQVNAVSHNTVMKAAQDAFDDIEYEHGYIEIDNDFDSFRKGVTLLVYSDDGNLIKGSTPHNFPFYTPLTNGEFTKVDTGEDNYIIYDIYNSYENGEGLWVRAVYPIDVSIQAIKKILTVILIVIPLILFAAIFAGRHITTTAFEPVAEITAAANSITTGKDLSKRVRIGGGDKDELYNLGRTINDMISRLETAFIAEKQFSSDLSHELKTPVAVILAECEYALTEDISEEEYRKVLISVRKQCHRMTVLTEQLLQMSRTINSEESLEKEEFNLSELCEGISEEISMLAENKGIVVEKSLEDDIYCYGDETLILRMIMNVLTNALKYSNKEEASPKVYFSLYSDTDNICISIRDNGIGISEEDLPYIFNRFYKADKSRSDDTESFGLGLSMVKWIVEAHNGSIEVKSRLNEGTAFNLKLPKT